MKKRLLSVMLAGAMAFALIGCEMAAPQPASDGGAAQTTEAKAEESAPAATGEAYKVAFICKDFSDTFCLSVKNEFEKAAADHADEFTVEYFDSQGTSSTQNDQIETCTASGFDAIIFQQVDAEAPVEVVKAALDKGIKVIVTTGHIEDDGASWYVDADPHQQGAAAVGHVVELGKLAEGVEAAILSGPVGNFHSDNRVAAFKEAIEETGATLIATEVAEWSKDKAMTATQNMLVANPDLQVILAANDDMALGAIEAIEIAGKGGTITVAGVDGTEGGIEAVANGTLAATVQQDAKGYAVEAMNIMIDLMAGKDAKSMNIDSTLITIDNVKDFQ